MQIREKKNVWALTHFTKYYLLHLFDLLTLPHIFTQMESLCGMLDSLNWFDTYDKYAFTNMFNEHGFRKKGKHNFFNMSSWTLFIENLWQARPPCKFWEALSLRMAYECVNITKLWEAILSKPGKTQSFLIWTWCIL